MTGKTGVTKSSLNPGQRRTLEIIQELGFGRIERLSIRDGQPSYDYPAPRVFQEIKLGSECDRHLVSNPADFTLTKQFGSLFNQLSRLREGIVDIEVRHGLPFRLVVDRNYKGSS
jgi:hypothetical protein